jgi:hypothetical protein
MEEGDSEEIIRKLKEERAALDAKAVLAKEEAAALDAKAALAKEEVAALKAKAALAKEEVAALKAKAALAKEEVAALKAKAVLAKEAAALAKEEAALAKEEAALAKEENMRLTFSDKVSSLEQFRTRDGMMSFIREAKFSSTTTLSKRVFQTADFLADEKSSVSRTECIRMSSFHRRQVADTADRMDLFLLDLNEQLKDEVFKHHLPRFKSVEAFKEVIDKEVIIIEQIRKVFCWMLDNRCNALNETLVQKVFVLYLEGLLKTITSNMSVLSANNVELEADIEIVQSDSKKTIKVCGRTDVALFKSTSDEESEVETTVCKASLNDLLKTDTIIGEMKVCDGFLSRQKSEIGLCRSQQLIEICALGKMREAVKEDKDDKVVKSFLTDFFVFGIALRLLRGPCDVVYLISSLYEDAEDMVFCILFLLADFSMDKLRELLRDASPLDKDNENEDDEVDKESVFSPDNKVEIRPLCFGEVTESKSDPSEDEYPVRGRKRKRQFKSSTNLDGGGGGGGKRNGCGGGGGSGDGGGAFSNVAGPSSQAGGGSGRSRSGNPQGGHAKGYVSSSGNKSSGHGRTRSSGGAARPGQKPALSPSPLANMDPNTLHIDRAAQRLRMKRLAHEGKLVLFGNEVSERREEAIRDIIKWEYIRQSGIAPGSYLSASNLAAHDSLVTSTK